MATDVKLPRLGQGMESGTIVKWLKAEGDTVEKGEPLYEVDTEKATQEVEAEASGVLLRIAVQGGEVPVGETLAFIGEPARAGSQFGRAVRNGLENQRPQPGAGRGRHPRYAPPSTARGSRPAASRPRPSRGGWRASAASTWRALTGTGPEGRIVAEDVERAAVSAPATPARRRERCCPRSSRCR